MRLARRAGSHTANSAITLSNAGAALNTNGSQVSTSNKKLERKRASPNAAAKPIATPAS